MELRRSHNPAFPRHGQGPGSLIDGLPENGGRRESRAPDAPAASYAKVKSIRASHHRFTGSIRPSLRNGFNGFLRALPGEPGLLSPSPAQCVSIVANLTPASGRQDHTTSPSAGQAHSSFALPASTASRPTFVTMANAPLIETGRAKL